MSGMQLTEDEGRTIKALILVFSLCCVCLATVNILILLLGVGMARKNKPRMDPLTQEDMMSNKPKMPAAAESQTSLEFGLNNLSPNSLPVEEGVYLLGFFNKSSATPMDRRKVIWSFYRVADFAAEQVLPGMPEEQITGNQAELRAMLVSQLEGFEKIKNSGKDELGAVSFNWKSLLALLLKFLPEIIGGFGQTAPSR